jgi:hypothetical protein
MIDIPTMTFLMADGKGDPNQAPEFRNAIGALYSLGYAMKFARKKSKPSAPEISLAPLEALWWADDMNDFQRANKAAWKWTVMLAVFGSPSSSELKAAIAETEKRARKKKEEPNPYLKKVRMEKWKEGKSAQVMHIGPYAEERPTIAALHQFIEGEGFVLSGKHHEIYISDPSRTAPSMMKTVVRQPIARKRA